MPKVSVVLGNAMGGLQEKVRLMQERWHFDCWLVLPTFSGECTIVVKKNRTTGNFQRMERIVEIGNAIGDLVSRPELFATCTDSIPHDVEQSMRHPLASPSTWRGKGTTLVADVFPKVRGC